MSFVNNLARLIVGSSQQIVDLRKSVVDVAEHNIPVLILGPSGSGKELVAQALAEMSGRSGKLVSVNCASIPHSLLEAELFGYEKGAFTGASKTHKGKFEQAHNGTLFLDEIGDMPSDLQSKLLRALETKTFTPVGSSREVAVDFRLVCATHKNLYRQVVIKAFRSDLFFRISAFPMRIPPLRDRTEDIERLVHHLAQQLIIGLGSSKFEIEKDALWLLKTFPWPGNVRQLRNVVECLIIRSAGKVVTADQVQNVLREQSRQRLHQEAVNDPSSSFSSEPSKSASLNTLTDYKSFFISNGKLMISDHLKSVEREVISAALMAAGNDYNVAAEMLHLDIGELLAKAKILGLPIS